MPEGLTAEEAEEWIRNKKLQDKAERSEKKKNSFAYIIISICIIGLFAGLLLGAVYDLTKKPIAETADKNKQESFTKIFPEADSYVENKEINISDANDKAEDIYAAKADIDEIWDAKSSDGNTAGHIIIITSHEGYGGDIQMAVAVGNDGVITGISVLKISETAGLGMEAKDDPSFLKQYIGKNVKNYVVTKNPAGSDEEITAISGATITSNAVTKAVNKALNYANETWGGAK
ncbi:RnfABCDGE type electron transport complex subunit G [Eubacterium ruminantium]|nr:RnfABCDGE type electron transport complex subunit G [Eubacterium ruminantium]